MGSGEKHNMISFHLNLSNLHHHHHQQQNHNHKNSKEEMIKGVPKGCMAILVGHDEGEEQLQRFIIPIMYIKHPLFIKLLKEAEEEYGFKHDGPITIPCHVQEFRHVQDMIDQEQHNHNHHHIVHQHQHQHQHQHHHNFLCFKA